MKRTLAQPEACCIANDFSQCDFVQNILKKALAHYQSKKKNTPKNKTKTPQNDACLEKMKNEPVICVFVIYTCHI